MKLLKIITNKFISNNPSFCAKDIHQQKPDVRKQDSFEKSNSSGQQNNKSKKLKSIALISAGIIVLAGGIFAIAKLTSKKSGKIIDELGEKITETKHPDSDLDKLGEKLEEADETIVKKQEGNDALQKQIEEIELIGDNNINQLSDGLIKLFNPEEEVAVREVLPTLISNSEKLNIAPEDFGKYMDKITPKNKDFLKQEGISLLADKFEQIKTIVKDPQNIYKLFSTLSADKKELFNEILNSPEKFKIKKMLDIESYLENVNDSTKNFAFNDVLPVTLKHQDKLNIERGWEIASIIGAVRPDIMDTIEPLFANWDKLSTTKHCFEVDEFLHAITNENKKNIQFLIDNAEQLDLSSIQKSSELEKLLNSGVEGILRKTKNMD